MASWLLAAPDPGPGPRVGGCAGDAVRRWARRRVLVADPDPTCAWPELRRAVAPGLVTENNMLITRSYYLDMTSPTSRRTLLQGGAATLVTVTAHRADGALTSAPTVTVAAGASPVVTSATAGATTASISWTKPTQGTVTGYLVSRNGIDSHGSGPWSTLVSAATSTKTFTNLVPGSTYILGVAAITSSGTTAAVTAQVAIPSASPHPQGLGGTWNLLSTGPSLSALAGPLVVPVAVEMDADLGNCAVWLADPGTAPPVTPQTVVHGKNLSSGRHVYGLYWTAGAIRVYMDGILVQSMPVDISAANKTLVVVGDPKVVYRASAYDPA